MKKIDSDSNEKNGTLCLNENVRHPLHAHYVLLVRMCVCSCSVGSHGSVERFISHPHGVLRGRGPRDRLIL